MTTPANVMITQLIISTHCNVSARTYMHWTAVSGFKAARVAQQGQPSTRCISYFRLSAGCRQFRSWPQENIVLIRHLDKLLHDTYV